MNFLSDLPPDTKIRFLPVENYGFPTYVTKEEAERIANWKSDTNCPLCEARVPLVRKAF